VPGFAVELGDQGAAGFGSPENPVLNNLLWTQVIESKRRIDGDERGAVDSHSFGLRTELRPLLLQEKSGIFSCRMRPL
jgi:hypothetical protein